MFGVLGNELSEEILVRVRSKKFEKKVDIEWYFCYYNFCR